MFAHVRGSTAFGNRWAAAEFAALLNRFYGGATPTLLRHDAVVDFTTLGDPVNAAARMQQHAAGGELVVVSGNTSAIASGDPRQGFRTFTKVTCCASTE